MRELFQALSLLESRLLESHGISLNEAVVLCSVGTETVTASTIVSRTGMTPSHASKVNDEIYFVVEELRKEFPDLSFTQMSDCSGVLILD